MVENRFSKNLLEMFLEKQNSGTEVNNCIYLNTFSIK